ncbi:EpsG family protein [Aerococcus urinaeequi]|uniref:EpsG family protein n=1 Tax=Aerococcus urinaeequi TaxID=51665 RepID=UPI003D6AD2B3
MSCFFWFANKKNKENLFLLLVTFLMLVLTSGLRGTYVGTDTVSYIGIFDNLTQNFQFKNIFDYSVEPLFAILNWVVDFFGGSAQTLIMVISLIVNFFIVKTIQKHSKDIFLVYFYISALTKITIAYFAFSILSLFYDANLMMRLGWYFAIFMTIYIPNTLEYIDNYKLKILLKYIIFCSVFLLHFYLLNMNFHRVVPYEFYFMP